MVMDIENSEGLLSFSDQTIDAVVQHAQRLANLTVFVMDASGLVPQGPGSLPTKFLLELGAILNLGMWEQQGLRDYIDTLGLDLPTFHQAAVDLVTRATQNAQEFEGLDAPPLCSLVLRVWMKHFAWDGPAMLGTEVVLSLLELDEDLFAEVWADFIWQHRQELAQFYTTSTDPLITTTP